jgi:hypothetical protein
LATDSTDKQGSTDKVVLGLANIYDTVKKLVKEIGGRIKQNRTRIYLAGSNGEWDGQDMYRN